MAKTEYEIVCWKCNNHMGRLELYEEPIDPANPLANPADEDWPITDVLTKLARAAEMLLVDHRYDGPGYDSIKHSIRHAHAIIVNRFRACALIPATRP